MEYSPVTTTANKNNYKIGLATTWFVFVSILFFLPGSALPSNDWLSRIWFDKWVHIGIFSVLLFLWCWSLGLHRFRAFLILLCIALIYGLLVEVIQDRFIPNRSFDWGDLLADFGGSLLGLWAWNRYKKNRPL